MFLMARATYLLRDDWWDVVQPRMELAGWSFGAIFRYDPTHIPGMTPGGRVFVFDAVSAEDGSITGTLVVAGRTRRFTMPNASWDSLDTETILTSAWLLLPVNQR